MKKLLLAGMMLVCTASAHATEYCGTRVANTPHGQAPVYAEQNTRSYKIRWIPDGTMLDVWDPLVPFDETEWTPIKDNHGWVETRYTEAVECRDGHDWQQQSQDAVRTIPGSEAILLPPRFSGTTEGTTTFYGNEPPHWDPTMADAPSWLKKRYSVKPRLRR
jgi:hypothetical protein